MRESLTGFLIAWLGGPREWFVRNPGKCVMSLHGKVAVSPLTARQWADAMRLAIADFAVEESLGARMADALEGMALTMARR
jgi:hemoglobin